jgi:hypothetical protein
LRAERSRSPIHGYVILPYVPYHENVLLQIRFYRVALVASRD